LAFLPPDRSDLDRKLSGLMNESREKLQVHQHRTDRPWQHGKTVVENLVLAGEIHKEVMERAKVLVGTFILHAGGSASEVVAWARPHLEILNRALINVMPLETRGEYGT
jgi:hypothetical protein